MIARVVSLPKIFSRQTVGGRMVMKGEMSYSYFLENQELFLFKDCWYRRDAMEPERLYYSITVQE
jgi:hypothetical protein